MMFRLQIGNGRGIIEWGNEIVDPNWARNLAKEKLDARNKKRQEDEKVLSDRQTIKAHSDNLWTDFRQELKKRIEELNKAMGEEAVIFAGAANHNRVAIQNGKTQSELFSVTFDPQAFTMFGPSRAGLYDLVIYGTNQVVWRDLKTSGLATSDEVARVLAEQTFKWIE